MAKDSLKTRKQRFDYYRNLDVDIHLLSPGQKKHHHPIAVRTRDWGGMIASHVEAGGNLGFSPGMQLLVIDVDVKKAKTGPAQLADFLKSVGLPPNALKDAPRITTPSGGTHYYLDRSHDQRRLWSTLPQYDAIDFLGFGANVVCAGSETPEGNYRMAQERSGPPVRPMRCPPEILNALAAPVEGADIDKLPSMPVEELEALVTRLPNPDLDYETWLKVGMAIHFESGGSVEGLQLWQNWSAKSGKFQPGTGPRKWGSFKSEGSAGGVVTWGTLDRIFREMDIPAFDFEPVPDDVPGAARDSKPEPTVTAVHETESGKSGKPTADGFAATPFDKVSVTTTPKARPWLYQDKIMRGMITLLSAPGGTGKSVYALTVAVSLAIGRDLLKSGMPAIRQRRVLLINNEDSADEITRRIRAIVTEFSIDPDEIEGQLWVRSGYGKDKVRLAKLKSDGGVMQTRDAVELARFAKTNDIDVIIADPLISLHEGVTENDNAQMEGVLTVLRAIAAAGDAGLMILHHTSKGSSRVDASDRARGASSIIDAVRVSLAMRQMTEREAEKAGVASRDRRRHVLLEDGKANLAAPGSCYQGFELVSVETTATDEEGNLIHESTGVVWPSNWPTRLHSGVAETPAQEAARLLSDEVIRAGGQMPQKEAITHLEPILGLGKRAVYNRISEIPKGKGDAIVVRTGRGLVAVWRQDRKGPGNPTDLHAKVIDPADPPIDDEGVDFGFGPGADSEVDEAAGDGIDA